MTDARRHVDLRPAALLAAGVSGVLCADLDVAEAGRWTLATRAEDISPTSNKRAGTEDAPIPIVTVLGPIEQRAAFHDPCGGVTDGYDAIEARFDAAARAVHRAGKGKVVMVIDSPGGDATGMLPAARRMRATADRLKVPVETVADERATSAGYALLLVGDRVNVPPRGRTASIGTVIARKADSDAGKIEIFRSGDRKMRPNSIESLNDQDRAELQAIVDAEALAFAQWAAERRGGKAEDYLALKGASMSGEEAARRGLIDANLTAHEVIAMATAEASRAAIVEALGLSAAASDEEAIKVARESRAAASALAMAESKAAEADRKLLALHAEREKESQEQARAKARSSFVSELVTARTEGRLTPKSEAALLAHYDAHGEASARTSLATVLEAGVALAGGREGHKPANQSGSTAAVVTLTEEQRARAKELGVDEAEYAKHMTGGA